MSYIYSYRDSYSDSDSDSSFHGSYDSLRGSCDSLPDPCPSDHVKSSVAVSFYQMLVYVLAKCNTFLIATKNKIIYPKRELGERSIVQFDLSPEQLRLNYCVGNSVAVRGLRDLIAQQKEDRIKETIDKQFTAYNLYNTIFDVTTYAVIAVAILSLIAVIPAAATASGSIFSFIVPVLLLLVVIQVTSLFLLYQEHQAIDKNIKTSLEEDVARLEEAVEVMEQNAYQVSAPNLAMAWGMLSILKNCNPINLIIAVRELNLVRIQKSIDEYNKLLENSTNDWLCAQKLMDTQLVNNIIIILGSLFINEQNKNNCKSYESYIKATKNDILTLINSPYINSVAPLISCFSGCNNDKTDKDYSLLKQAIVAKLDGITSEGRDTSVSGHQSSSDRHDAPQTSTMQQNYTLGDCTPQGCGQPTSSASGIVPSAPPPPIHLPPQGYGQPTPSASGGTPSEPPPPYCELPPSYDEACAQVTQ